MSIDSRTLKPVDSNSVKILATKNFEMSYFCRLKWHDFSQSKLLKIETTSEW